MRAGEQALDRIVRLLLFEGYICRMPHVWLGAHKWYGRMCRTCSLWRACMVCGAHVVCRTCGLWRTCMVCGAHNAVCCKCMPDMPHMWYAAHGVWVARVAPAVCRTCGLGRELKWFAQSTFAHALLISRALWLGRMPSTTYFFMPALAKQCVEYANSDSALVLN